MGKRRNWYVVCKGKFSFKQVTRTYLVRSTYILGCPRFVAWWAEFRGGWWPVFWIHQPVCFFASLLFFSRTLPGLLVYIVMGENWTREKIDQSHGRIGGGNARLAGWRALLERDWSNLPSHAKRRILCTPYGRRFVTWLPQRTLINARFTRHAPIVNVCRDPDLVTSTPASLRT